MSIKSILLNLMAVSISIYTVASKSSIEWLAVQEPILAIALMILMFMYILTSVFMTLQAMEYKQKGKEFYQAVCANALMLITGIITMFSAELITTAIYKPFILVYCYFGLCLVVLLLKQNSVKSE
ncbi:hypothetical protein PVK64_14970 [Aliivibrio sp. S4TY2]|uniref:Uncharacterized protein n=1 Tax=Aliivibrio finisterrensis TaxID=511998 RepID=A0A4Q5KKJ5_9GAMM|nr:MULTISPECIES: hypothetical protein [Aliivibrio]MDD9157474.1 hypothetical protein [Aliivibrio sp. S4TY2]MDD9161332.1 hypothetical protein [Aliivibrio sp. S4TY1]MDD9165362.1 hypothetical protein [Aliivibrio sp. S4MY2]MDD9169383.1 hypothetical protein [Aliivibrio sp. S4MY4]MDD9179263.1 hypothetical protein [Aliivibrio sp. A6]